MAQPGSVGGSLALSRASSSAGASAGTAPAPDRSARSLRSQLSGMREEVVAMLSHGSGPLSRQASRQSDLDRSASSVNAPKPAQAAQPAPSPELRTVSSVRAPDRKGSVLQDGVLDRSASSGTAVKQALAARHASSLQMKTVQSVRLPGPAALSTGLGSRQASKLSMRSVASARSKTDLGGAGPAAAASLGGDAMSVTLQSAASDRQLPSPEQELGAAAADVPVNPASEASSGAGGFARAHSQKRTVEARPPSPAALGETLKNVSPSRRPQPDLEATDTGRRARLASRGESELSEAAVPQLNDAASSAAAASPSPPQPAAEDAPQYFLPDAFEQRAGGGTVVDAAGTPVGSQKHGSEAPSASASPMPPPSYHDAVTVSSNSPTADEAPEAPETKARQPATTPSSAADADAEADADDASLDFTAALCQLGANQREFDSAIRRLSRSPSRSPIPSPAPPAFEASPQYDLQEVYMQHVHDPGMDGAAWRERYCREGSDGAPEAAGTPVRDGEDGGDAAAPQTQPVVDVVSARLGGVPSKSVESLPMAATSQYQPSVFNFSRSTTANVPAARASSAASTARTAPSPDPHAASVGDAVWARDGVDAATPKSAEQLAPQESSPLVMPRALATPPASAPSTGRASEALNPLLDLVKQLSAALGEAGAERDRYKAQLEAAKAAAPAEVRKEEDGDETASETGTARTDDDAPAPAAAAAAALTSSPPKPALKGCMPSTASLPGGDIALEWLGVARRELAAAPPGVAAVPAAQHAVGLAEVALENLHTALAAVAEELPDASRTPFLAPFAKAYAGPANAKSITFADPVVPEAPAAPASRTPANKQTAALGDAAELRAALQQQRETVSALQKREALLKQAAAHALDGRRAAEALAQSTEADRRALAGALKKAQDDHAALLAAHSRTAEVAAEADGLRQLLSEAKQHIVMQMESTRVPPPPPAVDPFYHTAPLPQATRDTALDLHPSLVIGSHDPLDTVHILHERFAPAPRR